MKAIIEPGSINGHISAPPSKSHTQRAYAAALLHHGTTTIYNPGASEDELAALDIIKQLGATITGNLINDDSSPTPTLKVCSRGVHPIKDTINCRESGLAARLFTPIAALAEKPITINGSGSLLKRPIQGLQDVCRQLNLQLHNFNGHVPFTIQGPLQPASIQMNGSAGSQLLSGLLFALSSCAKQQIFIEVTNLKSKPYIDLTLDVLTTFGKPITHSGHTKFIIDPSVFIIRENPEINIEGDWSSASFLLAGAAISGEVTINNLDLASHQPDKTIVSILKTAGALVTIKDNIISVAQAPMHAFEYDATHSPDLFPILAVLATRCEGESHISGVHRLFNKESNRAHSISEMLANFDIPFSIEKDTLCITGGKPLRSCTIDSFNDHRIAMAAGIGALRTPGPVTINNADAVSKSYPQFYKHLQHCGVTCTLA